MRQLLLCERCRLELHTLAHKLTGCSVNHRAQIVVTLSAFLKQASQQTALLVSTRASVANTQVHLRLVRVHLQRADHRRRSARLADCLHALPFLCCIAQHPRMFACTRLQVIMFQ